MRFFKWLTIFLFVAIIAIGGIFIFELRPVDSSTDKKQEFYLQSGKSTKEIAKSLKDDGLIRNDFAFAVYIKALKASLIPGIYELSGSQSATDIANMIATGKIMTARITIPEGWRVTQITKLLAENKITKAADFTEKAAGYEGYLFPDTYEISKDATSDEIIKLMRDDYAKRTTGLNVTPDALILASIVEREAQNDVERGQIAGVYANRLKLGMKLDADPTIQYAKGTWAAVTVAEYSSVISPYNTYLNDGLPPGPICNPGLASIKAALSPTKSDYLYFFHAKGQIFLSKTLAEHKQKIKEEF